MSISHKALDAAIQQNYIEFNDTDLSPQTNEYFWLKKEILLHSSNREYLINDITPEKYLIKKERFKELSSEAKKVINIVLEGPIEIFSFTNKITKQAIIKHLQTLGFSIKKINKIFAELKVFVNKL